MQKKILLAIIALFCAFPVLAQEVFWGYDEENKELIVPPECDSALETDELYEVGMRLFNETGYARQGASYCLLVAAMDNHPKAQYQIAYMYYKGILLPKSDLAAYKWATLAALNGDEEGDKLGASIEQFLSIQDIELSTKSLESVLPVITKNTQQQLENEKKKQQLIKETIKAVDAEVRDLKKYGYIRLTTQQNNQQKLENLKLALDTQQNVSDTSATQKTVNVPAQARTSTNQRAKANEAIFPPKDLDNVPMPSSI